MSDEKTLVFSNSDPPPPEDGGVFRAGEFVAGRYEIVRLLGAGGMGEVYEARDAELNEHIAIKTVRASAVSAANYERLKREIQLARRVTHPNVCRIFDLARHDTLRGPVHFVTMELIRGATLAEHLRQRGRLPTSEALPIARQIAAGLSAAHALGIVHGDLKAENVMLAESRAVIMDFGLARAEGDKSRSITEPGAIAGTPAYLAPEQCRGLKPTAAADVYAFGVILYALVTGSRPFDDAAWLETLVRKVNEPASSPRIHVPDLDPRWEAVILRCLEREPDDRFAGARDVVDALEDPTIAVPLPRRRRVVRTIALAVLAVLVIAAAMYWMSRSKPPVTPPIARRAAVTPRPSVAVIAFRNTTGRHDLDWLSTALAEMLTTELAAEGKIRSIAGEEVERARRELRSDAPRALSRDLNADFVVHGSYTAVGAGASLQIRVDARLDDTTGRGRDTSVADSGSEARLFDVVARIGARMRESIGVAALAQGSPAAGTLPAAPAAARAYAQGLYALRRAESRAARDLLVKAAAAEPNHPMIRFQLASALAALGFDKQAREEMKRAFDRSESLPREQRLLIEAAYRENTADWKQAIEIYRSLIRFFPDNVDYSLRLAAAQTRSGDPSGALQTVAGLRQLPEPLASDPRIDVAELDAAAALGDYPRLEKAAAKAIEVAKTRGARLVEARAESALGVALHRQGRTDEALARQQRALEVYRDHGDLSSVGRCVLRIGAVYTYLAKYAEAVPYFEQGLRVGERTGDVWLRSAARNNLAYCAFTRGEPREAERLLQEMLVLAKEAGDPKISATALDNLGYASYLMGDLDEADKRFRDSASTATSMHSLQLQAVAVSNIGDVHLARGEFARAHERYTEALKIRQKIGEKRGIAESEIALANVAVEQSKPEAAAALARKAIEWATKAKVDDVEIGARIALARALRDRGEIERALKLATERSNVPLRAQALVAAARIAAARGDANAARDHLRDVPAALVPYRLEADIVAAEIGGRRDAISGAKARAKAKGFRLLAARG
jgi:eukaryotic-like serine/threonine-protein kinase